VRRFDELSAKARQVEVLLRGVKAFGSAKLFYTWLHTPCSALGDEMPIALLTSPAGIAMIDAVMDVLEENETVTAAGAISGENAGTPGGKDCEPQSGQHASDDWESRDP
jgi:hypothetical protein